MLVVKLMKGTELGLDGGLNWPRDKWVDVNLRPSGLISNDVRSSGLVLDPAA
jgi:hypothetical protein